MSVDKVFPGHLKRKFFSGSFSEEPEKEFEFSEDPEKEVFL